MLIILPAGLCDPIKRSMRYPQDYKTPVTIFLEGMGHENTSAELGREVVGACLCSNNAYVILNQNISARYCHDDLSAVLFFPPKVKSYFKKKKGVFFFLSVLPFQLPKHVFRLFIGCYHCRYHSVFPQTVSMIGFITIIFCC